MAAAILLQRPAAFAVKTRAKPVGTAFGCPRQFQDHQFVYTVISPRARGLSVGVNMNPDKKCNFDCVYCEVDRSEPGLNEILDVARMSQELEQTFEQIRCGTLRELPCYQRLPADLLTLRHVTLSGDGEPTLCPNFVEAVQTVMHLRARGKYPFFKTVLVTNTTGLPLPAVQEGLRFFTNEDEIWAKLDAGTQEYLEHINRTTIPLAEVLSNILTVARERPVIIQSLFAAYDGEPAPPQREIQEYAARLKELTAAGAKISLVQIYSATRPSFSADCSHLPLRTLSSIAQTVRAVTGLRAEVF